MINISTRIQRRGQSVTAVPTQTVTHMDREDERAASPLILVVEDHPATQNVLASVLDLQGYRVVCANNGQEALEWLEGTIQTATRPAIILLDLFMPVMNGADFLDGMRAKWPALVASLPVILFTVDQGNHDDLGCTQILPKPFHIRDLLAKLKLALGNSEQMSA